MNLSRVRGILKTKNSIKKLGEGRGLLLLFSVGTRRMLSLPAREEQDLGGTSVPRNWEQAQGRGHGWGIGTAELQHRRISCRSRRASPRGTGPRKTSATRSLPAARGPLFILEPGRARARGRSRAHSRPCRPHGAGARGRAAGGGRRRAPGRAPGRARAPGAGALRAGDARAGAAAAAAAGSRQDELRLGDPLQHQLHGPAAALPPAPPGSPRLPGPPGQGAALLGPGVRVHLPARRAALDGGVRPGAAARWQRPAPLPWHQPRSFILLILLLILILPPAAPAPSQRVLAGTVPPRPVPNGAGIKRFRTCACMGVTVWGTRGAPSALGNSDGASLGLCNPAGTNLTRATCPLCPPEGACAPNPPVPSQGAPKAGDPEGVRCHRPSTGTHWAPPAPRVPPKQRPLCGMGPGLPQGGEPSPGAGPRPPVRDKRSPGVAVGTAMPSSWVLVLAVLGGACALPAPAPLAYTQVLAQAVDSYNQRPEVQNAFRLLSAEPEPAPGVELSSLQGLNFSMMETDCAASARVNPDDCDFKENGVIKECSGSVQLLQSSPEIDLRCSDASSDPVLIQRGRFGRFLGKVRHFRPRVKFDVRLKGSVGLG